MAHTQQFWSVLNAMHSDFTTKHRAVPQMRSEQHTWAASETLGRFHGFRWMMNDFTNAKYESLLLITKESQNPCMFKCFWLKDTKKGVSEAWIHRPSQTAVHRSEAKLQKGCQRCQTHCAKAHGHHADVIVRSCHISEAGGMHKQKMTCYCWHVKNEYKMMNMDISPHHWQSTRPCQILGSTLKSLYNLLRDIFKNYFVLHPAKLTWNPKKEGLEDDFPLPIEVILGSSGSFSEHIIFSITSGPPHWGTIFIIIFIKLQKGSPHHCLDNRFFMEANRITGLLWGPMRTNIFYQAGSSGSPIASTISSLLQTEGGRKELLQLLPVLPFHNTLVGYQLASIQCVVEKQWMPQLIHEAFQIIGKVKALCSNGPVLPRQVGNLHRWYHMSWSLSKCHCASSNWLNLMSSFTSLISCLYLNRELF